MPLGVLLAGCGRRSSRGAYLPPDPALRRGEWYRGGCVPPSAARFANYVSWTGRARGISFSSVGGNAGFAPVPL